MYNTDYVPQHTLIIASVLRYIMTFTEVPILHKYELDAFIITAVAPELSKTENTQELQVSIIFIILLDKFFINFNFYVTLVVYYIGCLSRLYCDLFIITQKTINLYDFIFLSKK